MHVFILLTAEPWTQFKLRFIMLSYLSTTCDNFAKPFTCCL